MELREIKLTLSTNTYAYIKPIIKPKIDISTHIHEDIS